MSTPGKKRQFVIKIECQGDYKKELAPDEYSRSLLSQKVFDFFNQDGSKIPGISVMEKLKNYLTAEESTYLEINKSYIKVDKINFLSNDEYDDDSYGSW